MLKRLYLIIGFVFLAMVLPAQAQHRGHHRHHHHHGGHHNWVVPAIISGAIVYGMTRPSTSLPPVVYQSNPPIVLQPGQQIVCARPQQVFNSITGMYEIRQECWVQ